MTMTAELYQSVAPFGDGSREVVRRTLGLSFALHVMLVVLFTMIRLPHRVEPPTASYEVSLVTLAAPRPAPPVPSSPSEPVVQPTKPSPTVAPPAVSPPIAMAKLPAIPKPVAGTGKAAASSQNLMKDLLQGIELPPEAPRFTDATPSPEPTAKASAKSKELQKLINQLTVPDIRPVPAAPTITEPAITPMSQSSVVEELEKLERQLRAAQPSPAQDAKPEAKAAAPTQHTAMHVEGVARGSNSYFSRVQSRIGRYWAPPRVDLRGGEPKVTIRFRLHRSGGVSDVMVERSSGNDYYDAAGKRAILSAYPLPPFPPELDKPYLDINFTFGVDQPTG
jgi:colicin import membrane protein